VHGSLVWEATAQQRVLTPRPSGQGRERAQYLGPEVAANTDLVALLLRIARLAGHGAPSPLIGALSMAARWVSGHRTPRVIRGSIQAGTGSFPRRCRVAHERAGW